MDPPCRPCRRTQEPPSRRPRGPLCGRFRGRLGAPGGSLFGRFRGHCWAVHRGPLRTISGRLTALPGGSLRGRFQGFCGLSVGRCADDFRPFVGTLLGPYANRFRASVGTPLGLLVRAISGLQGAVRGLLLRTIEGDPRSLREALGADDLRRPLPPPWRPCTGRPSAARRASSGPPLSHFFGSPARHFHAPRTGAWCAEVRAVFGTLVRTRLSRSWIPLRPGADAFRVTFAPARDIRVPCAGPLQGPLSGSLSPASPDP